MKNLPLERLLSRLTLAAITGAVLSACSTFVSAPVTGEPSSASETVTLECSWRFSGFAVDECHVSSVDGQRPGVSQFASLKTELAPGTHWVEFRIQHAVGFGGTLDVCAFEHVFLAGHRYRLLAHRFSADSKGPRKYARLYTGSVDFEDTQPDGTVAVLRPALTCSVMVPLCRTDSDCPADREMACQHEPGQAYGVCRKR